MSTKQQYISVFENCAGKITIAASEFGDDELSSEPIQATVIEIQSLDFLISALKEIRAELE